MAIYIALLRGVNVGPHKRMKMEQLRLSCKGAGFDNVRTYIQSGNIVFQASEVSPVAIEKTLGECITRDFGFSCQVIVRRHDDLKKIIENNPLPGNGLDAAKLHVVFLSGKPTAASIHKLQELTLAPDRVRVARREIYFYFPNGVSGSSLWNHPVDKVLGVSGTMRNWNTVTKLYQMAREFA
jgi:uncharacterized protein (DUF1697 family)